MSKQALEGFSRRIRLDEILVQSFEHDLVRQQLRRLIINKEDVYFVAWLHGPLPSDATTYAEQTGAAPYSRVLPSSRKRQPPGIFPDRPSLPLLSGQPLAGDGTSDPFGSRPSSHSHPS